MLYFHVTLLDILDELWLNNNIIIANHRIHFNRSFGPKHNGGGELVAEVSVCHLFANIASITSDRTASSLPFQGSQAYGSSLCKPQTASPPWELMDL